MMRNNDLDELANPVIEPTDDMHKFPDATTRHGEGGVGYVLYLHDHDGDGKSDTNYFGYKKTKAKYTCDKFGNVTQTDT
jgi:hypothetical protein